MKKRSRPYKGKPRLKTAPQKRVSGVGGAPLNETEQQIYALMQLEGIYATATLVARLKKGDQWIRKCKRHLADLGLWNGRVPPAQGGPPQDPAPPALPAPKIRLHAQKFRITLAQPPGKGYRAGLSLSIDGNNVQTFKSVICIQSRHPFYGPTEEEALAASMIYFERLFLRLERDLDVSILKDRRQNVEMTYAEWATEDSELSETAYRKGQKIRIYSGDGRLRFTVDRSKGYEHEAHLSPKLGGMQDSEAGNHHIGAFLDHPECPTLPQLAAIVRDIGVAVQASLVQQQTILALLQPPQREPEEGVREVPFYVG